MTVVNTTLGVRVEAEGALKALRDVERATDAASTSADKFTGKLSIQDVQLRAIARDLATTGGKMNQYHRDAIQGAGGMEKFRAIQAQVNAELGRTPAVADKATVSLKNVNLQAGQGRLAVGRLGTQFGTLTASMLGVHPVATNVLNVLGGFAVGSGIMAGALFGLAAVAKAYELITREARTAQKASREFADSFSSDMERWKESIGAAQRIRLTQARTALGEIEERLRVERAGRVTGAEGGERGLGGGSVTVRDTAAIGRLEQEHAKMTTNVQLASRALSEWEAAQAAATSTATGGTKPVRALADEYDNLASALDRASQAGQRARGIDAGAAFDAERARRERDFAPGSEAYKRQVASNQFARELGRDALDPMRREEPREGLVLGFDMKESLEASSGRQVSKLDEVKSAILDSGALMQATMMALGDKILIGGGGAGSRTGGGIGGLLGGAIGSIIPGLGTAIGTALGTVAGTALGSAIGGTFDKEKTQEQLWKEEAERAAAKSAWKAANGLGRLADVVDHATGSMGNLPDWVRVNSYRYAAAEPGGGMSPMDARPSSPSPSGTSGTSTINIATVNVSGVQDLDSFERELRKKATSGGIVFPGVVQRGQSGNIGGGYN